MTSAGVSGAWNARDSVTGAWRRSQKSWKRVRARVISNEGRNRKFSRSADEEANRAARAPRRRSRSQDSMAARGRFSRGYEGAWRRVARIQVTGFLGFGRGRSWSTSVVLVSTGEGLMCTDLKS